MHEYFWLVPLIPLLGAAVNGILGRRLPTRLISWIGCSTVAASFLLSLFAFARLLGLSPEGRQITKHLFTWIASGDLVAKFEFLLDPLSATMMLVVTGVGLLIHIYSTGYMAGDPGYYRFFAYLNLFTSSMLILAMANNFLLMFVGWEGVGLCSYLLIGYYFFKKSAGDAGKKAFVMNRIGDAGFLLGIMFVFLIFKSLDFSDVFGQIRGRPQQFPVETSWGVLSTISVLLFLGAVGKSAQFPLYTWLPDAMEGPTPVSALIHAATMVTAGVYMVVRCGQLYVQAPQVMDMIAIVGVATAFYAATIGLVQRDIKRILAYSTVSQLGYMFAAAGVGAFAAAMFHLVTHAFFKALLFLGAGSVITAFHHREQDITRMGGLKRYMPVTCFTMWVAALAISGLPPFSGFFSKDEILWQAFWRGHKWVWFLGWISAGLTAFYICRLMFLTFHGQERIPEELKRHLRESPPNMTVPLILFAILSAVGGYVGVSGVAGRLLNIRNYLEHFLGPVAPTQQLAASNAHDFSLELLLTALSILIALIGIGIAYWFYIKDTRLPEDLAGAFPGLYNLLYRKYGIDELYDLLFVSPCKFASRELLWRLFDVKIIDGLVNGIGAVMVSGGSAIRRIQSGYTRGYAVLILFGVVMVLFYLARAM